MRFIVDIFNLFIKNFSKINFSSGEIKVKKNSLNNLKLSLRFVLLQIVIASNNGENLFVICF